MEHCIFSLVSLFARLDLMEVSWENDLCDFSHPPRFFGAWEDYRYCSIHRAHGNFIDPKEINFRYFSNRFFCHQSSSFMNLFVFHSLLSLSLSLSLFLSLSLSLALSSSLYSQENPQQITLWKTPKNVFLGFNGEGGKVGNSKNEIGWSSKLSGVPVFQPPLFPHKISSAIFFFTLASSFRWFTLVSFSGFFRKCSVVPYWVYHRVPPFAPHHGVTISWQKSATNLFNARNRHRVFQWESRRNGRDPRKD